MGLFDLLFSGRRRGHSRSATAPRDQRTGNGPDARATAGAALSTDGPSPFRGEDEDAIRIPAGLALHPVEPPQPGPEPPPEEPDDDLDRATDALFRPAAPPARGGATLAATEQAGQDYDLAALREMFSAVASNHARPVKNLVFELRRGTAQKEWLTLCRPVMTALIEGARQTGLEEAAARMTDFDEALALAGSGPDPTLSPEAKELVLGSWKEMADALPEAFRQDEVERRRETIVIHSLLQQVPGVGHVTFVRLFSAGITDLHALGLATPAELAATTGIPAGLSGLICDRIQDYLRQVERERADLPEGERRQSLRRLVGELRRAHDEYESACAADWNDPDHAETKRRRRDARQGCALRIEVLLADLGELALAEAIQAMPFGARLDTLENFVRSRAH